MFCAKCTNRRSKFQGQTNVVVCVNCFEEAEGERADFGKRQSTGLFALYDKTSEDWGNLRLTSKYTKKQSTELDKLRNAYKLAFVGRESYKDIESTALAIKEEGKMIPKEDVGVISHRLKDSLLCDFTTAAGTPLCNRMLSALKEYDDHRSGFVYPNDPKSLLVLLIADHVRHLRVQKVTPEAIDELNAWKHFLTSIAGETVFERAENPHYSETIGAVLDNVKECFSQLASLYRSILEDLTMAEDLRRLTDTGKCAIDAIFRYLFIATGTADMSMFSLMAFHRLTYTTAFREWCEKNSSLANLFHCIAFHPSIAGLMDAQPQLQLAGLPEEGFTSYLYGSCDPGPVRECASSCRRLSGNIVKCLAQDEGDGSRGDTSASKQGEVLVQAPDQGRGGISVKILRVAGAAVALADLLNCIKDAAFLTSMVGEMRMTRSEIGLRLLMYLVDGTLQCAGKLDTDFGSIVTQVDDTRASMNRNADFRRRYDVWYENNSRKCADAGDVGRNQLKALMDTCAGIRAKVEASKEREARAAQQLMDFALEVGGIAQRIPWLPGREKALEAVHAVGAAQRGGAITHASTTAAALENSPSTALSSTRGSLRPPPPSSRSSNSAGADENPTHTIMHLDALLGAGRSTSDTVLVPLSTTTFLVARGRGIHWATIGEPAEEAAILGSGTVLSIHPLASQHVLVVSSSSAECVHSCLGGGAQADDGVLGRGGDVSWVECRLFEYAQLGSGSMKCKAFVSNILFLHHSGHLLTSYPFSFAPDDGCPTMAFAIAKSQSNHNQEHSEEGSSSAPDSDEGGGELRPPETRLRVISFSAGGKGRGRGISPSSAAASHDDDALLLEPAAATFFGLAMVDATQDIAEMPPLPYDSSKLVSVCFAAFGRQDGRHKSRCAFSGVAAVLARDGVDERPDDCSITFYFLSDNGIIDGNDSKRWRRRRLPSQCNGPYLCGQLISQGSYLAVVSLQGSVRLYSTQDGNKMFETSPSPRPIRLLCPPAAADDGKIHIALCDSVALTCLSTKTWTTKHVAFAGASTSGDCALKRMWVFAVFDTSGVKPGAAHSAVVATGGATAAPPAGCATALQQRTHACRYFAASLSENLFVRVEPLPLGSFSAQ